MCAGCCRLFYTRGGNLGCQLLCFVSSQFFLFPLFLPNQLVPWSLLPPFLPPPPPNPLCLCSVPSFGFSRFPPKRRFLIALFLHQHGWVLALIAQIKLISRHIYLLGTYSMALPGEVFFGQPFLLTKWDAASEIASISYSAQT